MTMVDTSVNPSSPYAGAGNGDIVNIGSTITPGDIAASAAIPDNGITLFQSMGGYVPPLPNSTFSYPSRQAANPSTVTNSATSSGNSQGFGTAVLSDVTAGFDYVAHKVESIPTVAQQAASGMQTALATAGSDVQSGVNYVGVGAKNVFEGISSGISTGAKDVISTVQGGISTVESTVGTAFTLWAMVPLAMVVGVIYLLTRHPEAVGKAAKAALL